MINNYRRQLFIGTQEIDKQLQLQLQYMSLEKEKFYVTSVVDLRCSKPRKQHKDSAKNIINKNTLSFSLFSTISLISGLFQSAFVGSRDGDFRNSSNHSLASYCATTEEKYFKLTWIASHIFIISSRLIIAVGLGFFYVVFSCSTS